jgi:Glycosyl transferase family 2
MVEGVSTRGTVPTLSIVTTVYDRVECLATCIRSAQNLNFADWEQIIVADCPPPEVFAELQEVVAGAADPRITLYNLPARANDFGISPAGFGLKKAQGKFLAFLDDDNAYLAEHFDALLPWLESVADLGFVYSACLYRGEQILADPRPTESRIDLGQIVFRRELFRAHLGDELRYSGYTWDWQLLSDLLARGVGYRFVDQDTFIFLLEKYRPFEAEALLVKARAQIGDLTLAAENAGRERVTERQALEASIAALERAEAALKTECTILGDARTALQANNTVLGADKTALQADKAALQQDKIALQADKVVLQTDKTALEADKAALQADKATLQQDTIALQADKVALQTDKTVLEADNAALRADKGALQADKAALQADKAKLQSELSASRSSVQELERQCAEREAEVAALKVEAAALEGGLAAARHEVAALRASLSWRITAPLRGVLTRLLQLGR